MPRLRVFPVLLMLTVLAAPAVRAADKASQDKLRQIESELARQKRQAEALERKEKETADSIQGLHARLLEATRTLRAKEDEQEQVEERLRGIEKEVAAKNAALARDREDLGLLTTVLIRLGRQPPETYFLRAGLTSDHIHRSILARSLLPRLQAGADATARDLAVLADLKWMAGEQKRLVAASRKNLQAQQAGLDELIHVRQGLISRNETQKAILRRQLATLTTEARDLRQLLSRVEPPGYRPRAGKALYRQPLEKPVSGPVIRKFGSRDADGVTSHGLTYRAAWNSRIVAPASGRVVFAGPFRGYGQILILQHKDGYHSFLAGFGHIDAEMGQEVSAGEPVGVLPVKGTAERPELYFEWRRNGEPVDPMEQTFRTTPARN